MQVVGKSGSWLKISRNVGVVWLADWVNYSRLDSSGPSGSQQPTAQIDNCCFVDRQCQSDKEWVDGYWAYQNGQCSAPAQPVASAPANVDNCCFVDRQCFSDQEWIDGYWAYQNRQCGAPAQPAVGTPSRPRIEGSDLFVRHISATLDWLESVAPEWYNFVITGMDLIVEIPVPVQPLYDGAVIVTECWAFANGRERKASLESCWIGPSARRTGNYKPDRIETASALSHEACHIHLHDAGINFGSREREEEECRKYGTGGSAPLRLAYAANLDTSRGASYTWDEERSLSLIRRWCTDSFRPEPFCRTIQRLEGG